MKFASVATTLAVAAVVACHGASASSSTTMNSGGVVLSVQEALEAVKSADLPAGVTLSGSVEPISAPAATKEGTDGAAVAAHDAQGDESHHEWFGGGWGGGGLGGLGGWGGAGWGGGGWGGWGGWGGFGPYRFGFNCGGIGGWAYPLGYWNSFGAGLYGGGCGLGVPFGGLYYC